MSSMNGDLQMTVKLRSLASLICARTTNTDRPNDTMRRRGTRRLRGVLSTVRGRYMQ